MRRVFRLLPLLGIALGAALASQHARADRIVLRNGGEIHTDHWWVDKDILFYDGPAGSVGIPRTMVAQVEPSKETAEAEPDRATDEPQVVKAGTPRPKASIPATPAPSSLPATARAELRDLVDDALAAFARRDFATASARFERAFTAEPTLSAARVGYALSEMALGRDERALPVVLDGLARDPGSADLNEMLGDLRNREEQVDDALRAWREAFRLGASDRLRDKVFKAERELEAGRDYAFSAAPHFNVRYDGKVDAGLAVEITDQLETSYRELADTYRHSPPQPITVLLYPEQQFRDVTQAPESVAGLYDGKIRVPLGGLRRLDDRARRVLVHELTHAVVHSKTRGNCPRWLHEGLAQRSEGRVHTSADRQGIARLLAGRDAASWDADGFSYPAALSLTRFLESRAGLDGLVEVLERLGEGASTEEALRQVYGEGYRDLCRRWAEGAGSGGAR